VQGQPRSAALHLHGDPQPVRQDGAVHLADRRGRNRGLVELEEEALHGEAELLLDHRLRLLDREGPHVVLEMA